MTPYLARGAEQPVAWCSLDQAPEDRARLIVIGTGSSHACHVLDEECLDDPETARAIAARFVAVRIDAEERPDVDARWQAGAIPVWPLVAIETPDGRRRSATRLSRAGFARLLDGGDEATTASATPASGELDALVAFALERMRAQAVPPYGGFSAPPKHPRAPALELLVVRAEPWARPLALRTLDAMSQGGLHDQLGGGFHRYATDDRWVVPHFEKRAEDQAALLAAYLAAFRVTSEPRYAEVARGIVGYVERRLALAGGGFACAEDADVGAYDDGSHYTWTAVEARAVLDEREWPVAERAWDLYGRGEMHLDPTRNVLFVAASPSELARELKIVEADVRARLASARARLSAARDERPRPAVDESIYVSVNAALARALLDAAGALSHASARDLALATFALLRAAVDSGRVPHALDGRAPLHLIADHAQLGLLALAAGDGSLARALADTILAEFSDGAGAFLDRPRARGEPLTPFLDGATPSGNALAGQLFAGVARVTGETRYLDPARSIVRALLPRAAPHGVSAAALVALAALTSAPPRER